MALRFALKKTCSSLARSGAHFHASAPAAAAAAAAGAAPAARPISDGIRTLNNVYRGVLHLHPSPVRPNNIGLCGLATRHLSTSSCPQAAAAKININHMKSSSADSSRRALRTYSSRAIMDDQPSAAAQLTASGASHRKFLKNVRLVACGLSLIWAITIYSAWSKPRRCSCYRRRGCNGRRGHLKS